MEKLFDENQELKDIYEPWMSDRDLMVLQKQKAEAIAEDLKKINCEKTFENQRALIRVALLASELERLNSKQN